MTNYSSEITTATTNLADRELFMLHQACISTIVHYASIISRRECFVTSFVLAGTATYGIDPLLRDIGVQMQTLAT